MNDDVLYMQGNWIRRRWLDFRQGHSIYLIFILSFSNFILIFHRLFIERFEFFDGLFSELWIFVVAFIIIYIPVAILIGHWHRKTQIKVETEMIQKQNPMMAKWWRIMIDIQTGIASKKEIDDFRRMLKSIEDGTKKPDGDDHEQKK